MELGRNRLSIYGAMAPFLYFNIEIGIFVFLTIRKPFVRIVDVYWVNRKSKESNMERILIIEDDYITKPFNVQILVQRVRAVLNRYRAGNEKKERIKAGNLEIDFQSWQVWKNGDELTLTPTEFKLLKKFCDNPGIVLTRAVLLEALWDKEDNYVDEHTLTIFISRLRSKIADRDHAYIRTIYGTGYQWTGE